MIYRVSLGRATRQSTSVLSEVAIIPMVRATFAPNEIRFHRPRTRPSNKLVRVRVDTVYYIVLTFVRIIIAAKIFKFKSAVVDDIIL